MNFTDITVARTIPASAEKVFDVWINPTSPGGPWFSAECLILNPVVDGLFYLAVKHEGRTWPHYGRFTQIDRPRLLEHTWMSEATKGAVAQVRRFREAKCKSRSATSETRAGPRARRSTMARRVRSEMAAVTLSRLQVARY